MYVIVCACICVCVLFLLFLSFCVLTYIMIDVCVCLWAMCLMQINFILFYYIVLLFVTGDCICVINVQGHSRSTTHVPVESRYMYVTFC